MEGISRVGVRGRALRARSTHVDPAGDKFQSRVLEKAARDDVPNVEESRMLSFA